MECKEFFSLVDCYLEGDIPEEKRGSFEQHYFECDKCFLDMQIREILHEKGVSIVLKGKKPIFTLVPKPLLAFASIVLLAVLSVLTISRISHTRLLYKISAFKPPIYMKSETRSAVEKEKFTQAMELYGSQQYEKALAILEELKDQAANPQVTFFKGICYLLTDRLKPAVGEFDIIIGDMNPSYYDEAIYYKAISLLRLGKKDTALELLQNLAQMFSPYAAKARALIEKIIKI